MGSTPPLGLVVLDLETTGLNKADDRIVEVAAIGVDERLEHELFTYTTAITPDAYTRGRLATMPEFVARMHQESGLSADLAGGETVPLEVVEKNLIALIDTHSAPDGVVTLSGSGGTHFDQFFLAKHLPDLFAKFDYAIDDAGVMRRAYHRATGAHLSAANLAKTHRALDDVRCHLDELRAFRDLFIEHAHRAVSRPADPLIGAPLQ